ncbi:MAG: protocatechuate 3,4-dioxygenase subunit alpha [Proteobacteria bacterium]|jgi:protocatechuate 3,4-dioxygenase alpha subunit|nr:protocatechuate 3,4-dioxygenase subunit alpha [Pseudomonadota bacterium]
MAIVKDEFKESPSQTAGPYVHIGCAPNFTGIKKIYSSDLGSAMKTGPVKGEQITIEGTIFDGTGAPLKDAMLEIWQADSDGLYNSPQETRGICDPNFTGWGRCAVNLNTGLFRFNTVKPGQTPAPNGTLQAPHISVWIVARGINVGLQTRAYFSDEKEHNSSDPILNQIGDSKRIKTLLAIRQKKGVYSFNIHLQGHNETVFFDI